MTRSGNDGRRERLNQIIAGYLETVQAGSAPNRDGLIDQHLDLADDLRSFFANHDQIKEAAQPDSEEATRAVRQDREIQQPEEADWTE